MRKITDNIFIGSQLDCSRSKGARTHIHACKYPCYRYATNLKTKAFRKTHPHYLLKHDKNDIFLNILDVRKPIFDLNLFKRLIAIVKEDTRPVFIHCNEGKSRAPSIAILLGAKVYGDFPNTSFQEATQAFEKIEPYNPSSGIKAFLQQNWHLL